MTLANATETHKLTLTRHFKASPQRVFEAWLDPQLLCRWLGPRQWVEACSVVRLEPVVGGRYELRMQPKQMPGREPCGCALGGVYRQIDRHTLLSFTWKREDEPVDTLVTVRLYPDENGTRLTLTHEGFATAEARDQHNHGWEGSITQMEELLQK